MKKFAKPLALLLAVAMASSIAGCGKEEAAAPAEGPAPAAEAGGEIAIGLLGPLTGDVAQYGLAVTNGAQLYFDQVNEAGGINGKQLNVILMDEKGDATEALNAYTSMYDQGIIALLGDVTSTPSIAVAQVTAEDNMPQVTASSTAEDVVSYGENVFCTSVNDPYQGTLMADYAKNTLGVEKVATIYCAGDDYSTGCNAAFVTEAEKVGIEVTSQEGWAAGDVDFNAQLTNMIGAGVDAIYCPNYYQDDAKILSQARDLGYEGLFLGVDGWASIEGYVEDAADLNNCFYCCSFATAIEEENVQTFVADYTAKFGAAPDNFCGLGYDAAAQIVTAITTAEEAGVEYGTDEYKQAIIDALGAQTIEGVTGAISYGETGYGFPSKALRILTFTDGELTYKETYNNK